MNQITLTKKGIDILSAINQGGETQYWVGYFGLAYVPVQNTAVEDPNSDTGYTDEGLRGLETLVGKNEQGDYIYNIWQGDLTGGGYAGSDKDFTRLTQYDANLSTNFRYSFDGVRNRLLTWTTVGDHSDATVGITTDSYAREGYRVYSGCGPVETEGGSDTDEVSYEDSEIPVPAPLLYLGSTLNYSTPDGLAAMASSLGFDWPKVPEDAGGYPRVTPDMRCYSGKDPDDATLGDDDVIASYRAIDTGVSGGVMGDYRCFVSLSNFNKGHAQVSSEGYETDYQESCHNMSRVTKLFPIAKYEIADADPETKDTRTGNANTIKYHLALDFGGDNRAYRDVLQFTGDGVFGENPNNSFKFNRVGIYAAPVSVRKFRKEGSPGCNQCQVEVDPDANPVLVAVISLDEVLMSEDGSTGFTRWSQDFILNLEHVEPDATTACVRDVEVYYNMAENEAITWYQNQLLASAGLSEAVTSLGVDVAYLKNSLGRSDGDCISYQTSGIGNRYETSTSTGNSLKHLVDADRKGSVRGFDSSQDPGYGMYSLTMGEGAKGEGRQAIVIGSQSNNTSAGTESLIIGASITNSSRYAVNIGYDYSNAASNAINIGAFGGISHANSKNVIRVGDYLTLGEAKSVIYMGYIGTVNSTSNSMVLVGYSNGSTVDTIDTSLILSRGITGSDSTNITRSLIIGANTVSKYTELNNVFSIGDSNIDDARSKDSQYAGPTTLTNVVMLGQNNGLITKALQRKFERNLWLTDDLCTRDYKDAMIFLETSSASPDVSGNVKILCGYDNPALYGIFETPATPVWGESTYKQFTQYIPVGSNNFDGGFYKADASIPGNNPVKFDKWLNNKTVQEIKNAVNKANLPMIYTGGIALVGENGSVSDASEYGRDPKFAGRLKLGCGVVPTAYIMKNPVSEWGRKNLYDRGIYPISVAGTTECPYGGMLLGIGKTQDVDGTFTLAVYDYPTIGPKQFHNVSIDVDDNSITYDGKTLYNLVNGKHTLIPIAGTRVVLNDESEQDIIVNVSENNDNLLPGTSFMLVVTSDKITVQYNSLDVAQERPDSVDITEIGTWMFTKYQLDLGENNTETGFSVIKLDN